MIIPRSEYATFHIEVDPDHSPAKELVTTDLCVGEVGMPPGLTEMRILQFPLRLYPSECTVLETEEEIRLGANAFGLICSKGTLSAQGLLVANTKIDPHFQGRLRIPVYNAGTNPITITKQMPFCSVVFTEMKTSVTGGARTPPGFRPSGRSQAQVVVDFLRMHAVGVVLAVMTLLGTLASGAGLYIGLKAEIRALAAAEKKVDQRVPGRGEVPPGAATPNTDANQNTNARSAPDSGPPSPGASRP